MKKFQKLNCELFTPIEPEMLNKLTGGKAALSLDATGTCVTSTGSCGCTDYGDID